MVDKEQATVSSKPKLYCILCFTSHLELLQVQDQQEVITGERAEVRPDGVLIAYRTSLSTIEKYK